MKRAPWILWIALAAGCGAGGASNDGRAAVTAPGVPECWIEDVLFEGDPFLTPAHRRGHGRGGFPHAVALSPDEAGVLRGARDIRIVRGLE